MVQLKTGASIGWHATVAAASAGIFMLVTKKGYEGGLKGRETWSTLLVPALLWAGLDWLCSHEVKTLTSVQLRGREFRIDGRTRCRDKRVPRQGR